MLKPFRKFARTYIDDIIIFSKTEEEYLRHLEALFKLFQKMNVSLSLKKSWLGYPSI